MPGHARAQPSRAGLQSPAAGAQGFGFEAGQTVERQSYDLLFGQRKARDGTRLGKPPVGGRKAAAVYARLLAAEPHATAGRRRELRIEATGQTRQSPLFFDLTLSQVSRFRSSTPPSARTRAWPARLETRTAISTGRPWSKRSTT
jgi:hypothetical protein